uniref:Uncharacterized protein n=2 Tax=Aeromonas sp. Ne-1 TaxID=1675689 RepID=A0A0H4JMZ9_9GAMM|nr:hypothetical protein [Aeromonas sp. Ne-1]
MKTCKYCGSSLYFIGELEGSIHFHCNYCELTFNIEETCENKRRKNVVPEDYDTNFYKTTKELLELNTIKLFYLLRECRASWYETLQRINFLTQEESLSSLTQEQIDTYIKPYYEEYEKITKQKFIIENILCEKAGFVPEKITEEFLLTVVDQGRKTVLKPMNIYVKNKSKLFQRKVAKSS